MFFEFKEWVVFTVSLFIIVSSTKANHIKNSSNATNIRNKRYNHRVHPGPTWANEGGYFHEVPVSHHHNYQNTFKHQDGFYNEGQHLNYDVHRTEIPPQSYFNRPTQRPDLYLQQQDVFNNRGSISTPEPSIPQFQTPNIPRPQFPPLTNPQIPLTSDTTPNRIPNIFGAGVNLETLTIDTTDSRIGDNYSGLTFGLTDRISCDVPYETPSIPNFEAPGRNISEVRCFEYIYQLKIKDDLERRNKACNGQTNGNPNVDTSGRDAEAEDFAHLVAIGWRGVNEPIIFKCGGSLISPNFILTAARCTSSAPDPELKDLIPRVARIGGNPIGYDKIGEVYVGSNSSNKRRRRQAPDPNEIDVGIINIIPHENYDPNMKYFDIALMQLAFSLDFNRRIRPACLWGDGEATNRIRKAVGTGWEILDPATGSISLSLQAGELDVINVTTGNNLLRGKFGTRFNEFADHQLCAGKLYEDIKFCQADTGGQLQLKIRLPTNSIGDMHVIVGVVSAAPDCETRNTPGIYTKVSSFVDWIEVKVWGQ